MTRVYICLMVISGFRYSFLSKFYPSSSVTPSMFTFIRARFMGLKYWHAWERMWSDVRLQLSQAKGLCPSDCPSSPQPTSLDCWQTHVLSLFCNSALQKQSQFLQKPTKMLLLTSFMLTQSVSTGADKAGTALQALAVWDSGFTWSTEVVGEVDWGQQDCTWLRGHPDSMPSCQQWLLYFFSAFLAWRVLVTIVSQADIVEISAMNQNSCCCDCQFVWSLKYWIKDCIFERSVPH